MGRKRKPVTAGNANKHLSYREAWGRIKGALAHGYYIEAISIEESIISDRLSSYLVRTGHAKPDSHLDRTSFANLIGTWRQHVPEAIEDQYFSDLQSAVDKWRVRRNKLIHGMVKSHPGSAPPTVTDFKAEAELAAREGQRLGMSVCNWYNREKGRLERMASSGAKKALRMPSFAVVWKRVAELQGEGFATITGLPFTYRVEGDALFPSRTEYRLSKKNVEKAYNIVPFDGPGVINRIVRGPAYVWAILHDPRVARGRWPTSKP
jgi:hypothetical protein